MKVVWKVDIDTSTADHKTTIRDEKDNREVARINRHCRTWEEDAKLIADAPAMLMTLRCIAIYCLTPAASHSDEIYLQKLKKDFEPILDECKKHLGEHG